MLEGGYKVQGGPVSALGRSVAAHVRALSGGFLDEWDTAKERELLSRELAAEAEAAASAAATAAAAAAAAASAAASAAAAAAAASAAGGGGVGQQPPPPSSASPLSL